MKPTMAIMLLVILVLVSVPSPATSTNKVNIDIQHYDLSLQIHPKTNQFNVQANIQIKALEYDISTITFLLNERMEIANVKDGDGNTLSYRRDEDQVIIELTEPLEKDETKQIIVEYVGVSNPEEKFGLHGFWGYIGEEGSYMIYESAWYPMIWGDRYTATITITVPKGQTAISVGQLIGETDLGQYQEYTWETSMPTRGISFAAGEYSAKTTLFKHMRVECYTYMESQSLANKCMKTTTDMLGFYSSKFGDYPYAKFATVEIPGFFSGGHGDQSFVMLDSNIFMSFLPSEFLAHEVAHNWWGALVFIEGESSLRSVKGYWNFPKTLTDGLSVKRYNLWLLEGFATYSSVLYIEEFKGIEEMRSSMEDKRLEYIGKIRETEDAPISSVEEEYGEGTYHAVVYSKGAWVLHMLRYVVGDEAFFTIMRNYAQRFRGKSANINDFQEIAEEVYGQDMDWFFDQWIEDVMLPDYALQSAEVNYADGKYSVKANVVQKGDLGKMPVDIVLYTKEEEIKKRVWIEAEQKTVSFTADSEPTYLEIDADHWILESNKSNNVYFISSSSFWRKLRHIIWRLRQLLPII